MTPVITKDSRHRPAPGRLPLDFRPVGPERTPARRPGDACSDGDRLTLEERISSVWEGLVAAGAGECPVCRSRMEWIADHGRCSICGTRLY